MTESEKIKITNELIDKEEPDVFAIDYVNTFSHIYEVDKKLGGLPKAMYNSFHDGYKLGANKNLIKIGKLKDLLSDEVIENALVNYIESFSFSMLPQDTEYLEHAEKIKDKAKDILEKIKELKNENKGNKN